MQWSKVKVKKKFASLLFVCCVKREVDWLNDAKESKFLQNTLLPRAGQKIAYCTDVLHITVVVLYCCIKDRYFIFPLSIRANLAGTVEDLVGGRHRWLHGLLHRMNP